MQKSLAEKLGVNPSFFDQPIGKQRHAIKYSVDLNKNVHQLFVYTDIACYTFLGDVTAPILRVIPYEPTKGRKSYPKRICQFALCTSGKILY